MHKQAQPKRRLIGTLELAAKLHCHPASIPRLTKQGRIPQPGKVLNKNVWYEDEIDALVAAGFGDAAA
jgi:predicted DNA-binding transcriptional regulator AlpA